MGRTPWSGCPLGQDALVPLLAWGLRRLQPSASRPGGRLRTRGSAPQFVPVLGIGKTKRHWALAEYLSQSLIPMALGLVVAIMASASYKYLSSCMAGFDIEMRLAARAMPDYLVPCITTFQHR